MMHMREMWTQKIKVSLTLHFLIPWRQSHTSSIPPVSKNLFLKKKGGVCKNIESKVIFHNYDSRFLSKHLTDFPSYEL